MPSGLRERWGFTRSPRETLLEDALTTAALPLRRVVVDDRSTAYQRRPIAWMVEQMLVPEQTLRWSLNPGYDLHHWDGTPDPLVAICQALSDSRNVGVESATGTQKTFTAALLMLWFLDCFQGSIVTTVAPGERQLEKHLWKEADRLWPRFKRIRPAAVKTHLRIQMIPGSDVWAAQGLATGVGADEDSATKAQGSHAEHQLFIVEETPGMNDAVLTAIDNTCTAPHNLQLRLGNPDHQLDPLHRFCERPSVVAVRMSSLDHPNVVCDDPSIVPGACSRMKNTERLSDYGEESPIYQSRTRGVSPAQATDALIKLEWLQASARMTPQEKVQRRDSGAPALGHDVANSEAGDRASLAKGTGALLERVTSFQCPDASEFARLHVAPLIGAGMSANRVGVDTVGVGASAFNELKRLKHFVVGLSGGSWPDPAHEEEFADLRSQMYWTFRQELFHREVAIAVEDQELFMDLVTPKWGTRNGKIFVESKETLKKRLPGGRSPDKGDAAVYWNWVRKDRRPKAAPPRHAVGTRTGIISG